MALHTRRGVLLGVAGFLAGLAGCNEESEPTGTPAQRTPTDPGEPRELGETGTRDPEQHALRGDDGGGTIAWFAEDVSASGDSTGGEDGAGEAGDPDSVTDSGTIPPRERRDEGLVTDGATAATLSFSDVEGVEEARAFVAATDFDSESLYLHQTPLGDCYRLKLCSVSWGGEAVSLRYVPVLESYDVACSAEERDTLATFVRIPVALDPGQTVKVDRSNDAGRCGRPRTRPTPGERDTDGTASVSTRTATTAASGRDDR
jgi:hypothetical protein